MMNLFKRSYSQFLFSWNIVSNLLKILQLAQIIDSHLQEYFSFTFNNFEHPCTSWQVRLILVTISRSFVMSSSSSSSFCTHPRRGEHSPEKGIQGCAALKTPFSCLSCCLQDPQLRHKSVHKPLIRKKNVTFLLQKQFLKENMTTFSSRAHIWL